MIEWEDVSSEGFGPDEVPELAMDPDERTLSVCNTRTESIVAYITIYETKLRGRHGRLLTMGSTTNNEGVTRDCITFIVLCPPKVFAHLCYLDVSNDVDLFQDIDLESDVQEWNRHPKPLDHHPLALGFPLQSVSSSDNDDAAASSTNTTFLCTQGVGGQLTHFFNGNLHAIDFRCSIGTPILAVGDGIVLEAKDHNTLTGIAVSNLFEWNTIMLQLDPPSAEVSNTGETSNQTSDTSIAGPLFVEYVHIQKSFVKEGDRVTKGQAIGESGSIGFSPEPHLHFAAYRSKDDTAPTVQVHFQSESEDSHLYLPIAGKYYDASGLVVDK